MESRVLTEVFVPSEPSTVASINVHHHVGQVELLQSVCDTRLVTFSRFLAGDDIGVGDQVGEGIWLNDKSDGGVGVGLEDLNDC